MADPDPSISQAVYESTARSMRTSWPETETAHALLDLTEGALSHVELTVDGFRQMGAAKIDCMAGCAFCCSLRIDARAHETLMLTRWLRTHLTAAELEALRVKAESAAAEMSAMSHAERGAVRKSCVLLAADGTCSAYEARPAACRRYLSGDVKACEALWRRVPGDHAIQYPLLEESGRYAAAAVHNEFVARGYDGYSYDLLPSLAEALTDTAGCAQRWMAKERVFSASAESWTPEGFSQEETLAKLKASLAGSTPAPGRSGAD